FVMCLVGEAGLAEDQVAKRSAKEALKAFNDLIGTWRGTGTPEGTREEKQRGFWTETMSWEWQFKEQDAWLKVDIDKGKYFTAGQLRYVSQTDLFQLTLQTPAKDRVTFTGPLKSRILTLERFDQTKKESQRLVLTLLHSNRFLYRYEVKSPDRPLFTKVYQV